MKTQKNNKKISFSEPRINDDLKGNYDVRVIRETIDGETINEVMPLSKAKYLANDKLELDLIEINQNATPPIMRIDNYSKWLYHEKKKAKENKPKILELKEIQLTPNIGQSDLEIKAKRAITFIEEGHKVKVVLTMKRREATRREETKRRLYEFLVMVENIATPESMPKDEGLRSIVILKRKKN